TEAMYGVVNEPGGTGTALKIKDVELSGKSGTAQVIGYNTRAKFGKQKRFDDNGWFVGYAPRRNPEIVVAVLVQEGGGLHGGETAGPVARDIVKAYYDKKMKKMQGEVTADNSKPPAPSGTPAAALVPRTAVVKEEESAGHTAPVRNER
ncbi:MAG TPA: penicillin-binding transpeptidase domain-containing protein, partial [Candidatus Limnocylindrales bacterium]|nr:penicillin-binding transpeptidase domain-containing protein [Candidatus Limnocylindrales bacterium]